MRETRWAGLLVCAVCLVGCPGPGPINPGGNNVSPGSDATCQLQVETVSKTKLDVGAKLDYALISAEGQAAYDSLQEVKNGFDQLQRDFDLQSFKLCKDRAAGLVSQEYYEHRRTCMDNALSAMRVMDQDLVAIKDNGADAEKTWALESKLAWIQDAVQCDNTPPLVPAGGAGAPAGGAPIELTAFLVCQRKIAGGFEDVVNCDGAELREGDRVRFGFKTDKAARIYLMSHNSTGQFQMLFPDVGVDNESIPGAESYVPADDWFYLDDVSGVTEIIQFVATEGKVADLEALRGKEFPPERAAEGKKPPKQHKAAYKTRGLLEPVITRGFKLKNKDKKPTQSAGAQGAATIPSVASRPGAAAIEMRIIHR